MKTLMQVGKKVTVSLGGTDKVSGTIASYPFVVTDESGNYDPQAGCVAVRLDKGFYSEDRKTFVSVLLAHVDMVEAL